jgi:hypothetical protein
VTIEDEWQRDIVLADLRSAMEHKRNEARAAYAVWSRLTEELHRMEIEEARWMRELGSVPESTALP